MTTTFEIHTTKLPTGKITVKAFATPDYFAAYTNPNNHVVKLNFPNFFEAKQFASNYQSHIESGSTATFRG
ncbi:hypothetical protein GD1_157 [Paraglaciecola Antarctic GD virus 1]|nr:hypothetical protein GD1_157 [Paraglaciecola Antarctic GD virus 1]